MILPAPVAFRLVPYHEKVAPQSRRASFVKGKRLSPVDYGPGRLVVDGRLVGQTTGNAELFFIRNVPPGVLAGSVDGPSNGAYMISTFLGFVVQRGVVRTFPGMNLCGVTRDGSVLLRSVDQPPSPEQYRPDRAWFDRAGRRTVVGPVDAVWLLPDGSVLGRAYRNPDGAYANVVNRAPGSRGETFLWRGGKRTDAGAWWPVSVNVHGVALGLARNDPDFRGEDRDRIGPLVRWEGGRLTPVDLGGRLGCRPLVARDDGSFVVGVTDGRTRRLGILRDGRLVLVPSMLAGKEIDPKSVEVDEGGRLFFRENRIFRYNHVNRWQIVTAKKVAGTGR